MPRLELKAPLRGPVGTFPKPLEAGARMRWDFTLIVHPASRVG